jgi:hypothetical protein
VQVSVIESGGWIDLQAILLIVPEVGDMKPLIFPSYSFLIEHRSGRKILFDLSVKKDWHNIAPHICNSLLQANGKVNVLNNVIDVLIEHGVQGKDIDTIVWSHYHFDQWVPILQYGGHAMLDGCGALGRSVAAGPRLAPLRKP